MATKQTFADVQKTIVNTKEAVAKQLNRSICCTIRVLDVSLADKVQQSDKITYHHNKDSKEEFMEEFSKAIDSLVAKPTIQQIDVNIHNLSNRGEDNNYHISTTIDEPSEKLVLVNPNPPQQEFVGQPNSIIQNTGTTVKNILGMMGFDKKALNGISDDEFGGFGAIMQVRENLLENRFIQADKDRRYDEMVTEKAKLESKLEALQKELDNANKYSEELEDKIDDLECKIEDLEHLKPEYSLGGMSLVGILEKTATNLAIKHADVLGGLAGMSKDEMVTLLQKPQTEAPTPQQISNEEVEVSQVSPRSEHINAIGKFVDTLSDDEFNDFWSVMQAFAKDKTLINKTLTNITNE